MAVWALADLHLSFGVPDKKMDIFGGDWVNHEERVAENWREVIHEEDLVLIAGDISWSKHLEDTQPDLAWIEALPGTKVMIKGNHDYWWTSRKKVEAMLPPSIHLVQNDAFEWNEYSIAGARLWDTPEYSFDAYVPIVENPRAKSLTEHVESPEEAEKIYRRELMRLENSLRCLKRSDSIRIAMTHYPPIGPDLHPSRVSDLFQKYGIQTCVFGHLHNVPPSTLPFGEAEGVRYVLTSCDYLQCKPIKIYP